MFSRGILGKDSHLHDHSDVATPTLLRKGTRILCAERWLASARTAEKAALVVFFSSKRGTRVLHAAVADSMVAYCVAKPITLRELDITPPLSKDAHADWLDEWRAYARSSGLTDEADIGNVERWIKHAEAAALDGRSGRVHAVADALARAGVSVDRTHEAAIASALLQQDRGERDAQCRDVGVVWVIYTGSMPGEEARTWFAEQRAASIRTDGKDAPIDVRKWPQYYKLHAKTTLLTLEKALHDKRGKDWKDYLQSTVESLNESGFSVAAGELMKLANYAESRANGDPKLAVLFLKVYFFKYHLGKGIPIVECHSSAFEIVGPVSEIEEKIDRIVKPTVAAAALPTAIELRSMVESAVGNLMVGPGQSVPGS